MLQLSSPTNDYTFSLFLNCTSLCPLKQYVNRHLNFHWIVSSFQVKVTRIPLKSVYQIGTVKRINIQYTFDKRPTFVMIFNKSSIFFPNCLF